MVDLTIEDQSRLKVIYGSAEGFHAVDLDSATVYDIYLPKHVSTYQFLLIEILRGVLRNLLSPVLGQNDIIIELL